MNIAKDEYRKPVVPITLSPDRTRNRTNGPTHIRFNYDETMSAKVPCGGCANIKNVNEWLIGALFLLSLTS